MSLNTNIVLMVGGGETDVERVLAALTAYADGHHKGATFERVGGFASVNTGSGHGEVIVGTVNYLDEEAFFETLRAAASDPAWSTYFAALAVICNSDDDEVPRTRTLNNNGVWA